MKMNVNFINNDLDEFDRCILSRGMNFSRKRMEVARRFLGSKRHYTVEQLYAEMKSSGFDIGYSTVYRTLRLLSECGLATAHHFNDNEMRYEPAGRGRHHDHLVCRECGRIIEFTHGGIERFQEEVASEHDFRVTDHELQIYGICSRCRGKDKGR